MRASKIGCLLVLSGAAVTLNCGAGSKGYVSKGSEQITTSVVINNCTATPDTAAVFLSTNLSFSSSDGNTYQLAFKGSPPVPNGTFSFSANPTSQHVQRSLGCWVSWGNCYYPYTLTKNQVLCPDPGVHIIPGGP
jgi:hypothetical protein